MVPSPKAGPIAAGSIAADGGAPPTIVPTDDIPSPKGACKPAGFMHYRCGRLITVRRVEAGIPRAEDNLEHAALHCIVVDPTGLHALFDTLEAFVVIELKNP
jgi:hypothetical protein